MLRGIAGLNSVSSTNMRLLMERGFHNRPRQCLLDENILQCFSVESEGESECKGDPAHVVNQWDPLCSQRGVRFVLRADPKTS
jgi:hypothetical protein